MILTSDKKLLKILPDIKLVTPRTIFRYNDNEVVSIVVGSRALAKACEKMDLPNLKFIQLLSAGFEGIDISHWHRRGVMVSNAANVYSTGMSEFIVYSMLMGAKRYNRSIKINSIRFQRGYKYITELAGKTVGIMGVGSIGKEVAKRLSGFDMRIIGYDLISQNNPYFEKIFSVGQLKDFLPHCDYLIITLPLNNKTEGIIDNDVLKLLKSNATIINVGRQSLINKKDFIAALKHNKEMSAVLDMFELIPNPITNPYRRLSNVKVLPGVTAISKEIDQKLQKLILSNIDKVQRDLEPEFVL